jgi:uncharacterized protein YndB with AHSA1/START domain
MIHWPQPFAPEHCPVHVINALTIPARPEDAWAWLVRAELWPSWYPNAKMVRIVRGSRPDLGPGTSFRWRTFGVAIASTVVEFDPPHRLAWDARGLGLLAYHAWLLEAAPDGCRVLTEETQKGWLARAGALLMPNRMHHFHQIWLERLAEQAEGGPPAFS